MIKKLSNIIKEDKKVRAIDKMLGCTCDRDRKPILSTILSSENGELLSDFRVKYYTTKDCPIHGYKRFRR